MEEGIKVLLEMQIEKGKLQFLLENNYEKMPPSSKDLTYRGIGLKNVQKRLELLYPKQHKLQIRQYEGLYYVQLDLIIDDKS